MDNLQCSTCKREVYGTKHSLDDYKVDYYGVFRTIAGGQTIAESITCIDCYEKEKISAS